MCGAGAGRSSPAEHGVLPRTAGSKVHDGSYLVGGRSPSGRLRFQLRGGSGPDDWFHLQMSCPRFSVFFRDLSVDLLQMIPDNHVLLAKLCAFYPGNAADIDQLHDRVSVGGGRRAPCTIPSLPDDRSDCGCMFSFKCGLPSLEECRTLAEAAICEGDFFSAVKFHLLSSDPENALHIGINHVKGTQRRLLHVSFLWLSQHISAI